MNSAFPMSPHTLDVYGFIHYASFVYSSIQQAFMQHQVEMVDQWILTRDPVILEQAWEWAIVQYVVHGCSQTGSDPTYHLVQ